jgi:hypothetical protein
MDHEEEAPPQLFSDDQELPDPDQPEDLSTPLDTLESLRDRVMDALSRKDEEG